MLLKSTYFTCMLYLNAYVVVIAFNVSFCELCCLQLERDRDRERERERERERFQLSWFTSSFWSLRLVATFDCGILCALILPVHIISQLLSNDLKCNADFGTFSKSGKIIIWKAQGVPQ